ncbi:rho GTPase-activating protein 7-like [Curcuma longa]|uniref:rho GTPase-activating protein 7-like n=1 Tax=Curcuma longa TaxID=136217 RepID=UPI003D9F2F9F
MASSNSSENVVQSKACGEGDTNVWTKSSENPDKQTNKSPNCDVFKSGYLFISSKGIGWTSWKRRWFVLTEKSLVFYRADPATVPQKGNETNASLGGIDLNSSGSVVIKADKKLLTVLFPDGRTFTLKAETSEDLFEWKAALDNALAQAPSAALAMGQNGIFQNDTTESIEASDDPCTDPEPANSTVIAKSFLLELEDDDGSPSFLEKALRFIEEYGVKVEGILRQSADVEEVKRRLQEYEQGKVEFSSDEDAHVVGDCIKYVLRESPSYPVSASCCTALVDAYRTERGKRVDAIRTVIYKTFPESSRHLMHRFLKMMQTVAIHKSQNRMSLSALAACMAPLLLRPLLAGDCEFEDNFSMGGDGSLQLLKAAAAANHAQLIIIILLEEFDKIFDDDSSNDESVSSEVYSDSEDAEIEEDYSTDSDIPEDDESHDDYSNDDSTDNDNQEDDGYHDQHNGLKANKDDSECSGSGTISESYSNTGSDSCDNEVTDSKKEHGACMQQSNALDGSKSRADLKHLNLSQEIIYHKSSSSSDIVIPEVSTEQKYDAIISHGASHDSTNDICTSRTQRPVSHMLHSFTEKIADKSKEVVIPTKRPTVWGRTPAKKNLSMESVDLSSEDELSIQILENTKNDLQDKIAKEVKENAILQENLQRRKKSLFECRLALEQEVKRLQNKLQDERDLRASLESGLMSMRPENTSCMDNKTRADLEEVALAEADIGVLKQKLSDLHGQLIHPQNPRYPSLCESCRKYLDGSNHSSEKGKLEDKRHTDPVLKREEFLKEAQDIGKDSVKEEARSQESSTTKESGNAMEIPTLKEAQELSSSNKQNSRPEWPSSIALNLLKAQSSEEVAKRLSSETEETTSASVPALAKLTNRLNLLRERRAKLANEMQNAEKNCTSAPVGPPQTGNSS